MLISIGTGFGNAIILPTHNKSSPIVRQVVFPSEGWASFMSPDPLKEVEVKAGKYLFRTKKKGSLSKFLHGNGLLLLF